LQAAAEWVLDEMMPYVSGVWRERLQRTVVPHLEVSVCNDAALLLLNKEAQDFQQLVKLF
jgi:hypothetical protein